MTAEKALTREGVGAHVSTRGGYAAAARRAWESGAGAYQYFPKNPRSLRPKAFDSADAARCAVYGLDKGIQSIAHTPYPTNPAAGPADSVPRPVMTASIRNDLEIAEACGSAGIVVHFGHFKGNDPLQGYQNIIQCINESLDGWRGRCRLLLENQAGQGGTEGAMLEELVKVRELCRYPEKVGFCFDTCHAYASGLWNPERTGELLEKGDRLGYWSGLAAVHLNDSVYGFGSRRDRHARIGEGQIGAEALRGFLTSPPVVGAIAVLETEPGPDGTHRQEIGLVRSWRTGDSPHD
ncbi:deoxyribonuclease IV [Paenibacillus spiritus]|uniref:Deoxyribonuclease IV n=1 Tax=Paenibacillus spiritus TaxID=2496557 RepID=A0A5J5GG86_9BACL|nr:deoxyribonuclease IV [Paenibacillus spiritus]KAA9006514.1 deoxyribonuclease IV [Paenibacillus spiritus]